ncbi:MAG TPA: hypothetical protein VNG53_11630, partial [Bacteroidia bacterium]|nr:hypothetical protein [Bacteroidia bacterium]
MEEITFDSLTPLMSETHDAIYDKYLNNWSSLDEKIADLPQEEEILVNYFEVLMAKLWFKYLIVNPAIPEHLFSVFMKDFLLRYFKSMETLYSEETVPKELISYIETIHIPNEEKLRAK